jgi:hypothetical protein
VGLFQVVDFVTVLAAGKAVRAVARIPILYDETVKGGAPDL